MFKNYFSMVPVVSPSFRAVQNTKRKVQSLKLPIEAFMRLCESVRVCVCVRGRVFLVLKLP